MHDVYKNIDDYNPDKKNKILIVTELFIRGRKLNISLAFITHILHHILRFHKMLG